MKSTILEIPPSFMKYIRSIFQKEANGRMIQNKMQTSKGSRGDNQMIIDETLEFDMYRNPDMDKYMRCGAKLIK